MCMACDFDFLSGLDAEALGPAPAVAHVALSAALHLQDLAQWYPRAGVLAGRVTRCPLYSEAGAAAAYETLCRAQAEGVLPVGLRLQVNLPTPFSMAAGESGTDGLATLAHHEQAVLRQLDTLLQTVPIDRLALRWDVQSETRIWETRGRDLGAPRGLPERLLESFCRICEPLPIEVELGLRFTHGAEAGYVPTDSGQVTRLIGAITASIDREPGFVDVPVPADRSDSAYFEPLANLGLWPDMEVFLSLVHPQEPTDASIARIAAAQTVVRRFGLGGAGRAGAGPVQFEAIIAAQERAATLTA